MTPPESLSLFLTRAEVEALTGHTRAVEQQRWCLRKGWRHTLNDAKQVIIARGEFDKHMVSATTPTNPAHVEVVMMPVKEFIALVRHVVDEALDAHAAKAETRATAAQNDQLWRVADVISFFDLSSTTVTNRILAHPTFPRAAVSTGTQCRHQRWRAGDVRAWRDANPDIVPRKRRPQIRKQKG